MNIATLSSKSILKQLQKDLSSSFAFLEIGGLPSSSAMYFFAQILPKIHPTHLFVFSTEEEAEKALAHYSLFSPKSTTLACFPFWGTHPFEERLFSEALALLKQLEQHSVFIFCSIQSLLQQVPSPKLLQAEELILKKGDSYSREIILQKLSSAGFIRTPMVGDPGEFSVRGSIIDLYPFAEELPYRLEFFGEELEDIRVFQVEDQRSLDHLTQLQISLVHHKQIEEDDTFYSMLDYLPKEAVTVFFDPQRLQERAEFLGRDVRLRGFYLTLLNHLKSRRFVKLYPLAVAQGEGSLNFEVKKVSFAHLSPESLAQVLQKQILSSQKIHVVCRNRIESRRFQEFLNQHQLEGKIQIHHGSLSSGFDFPAFEVLYGAYFEFFPRPQLPYQPQPVTAKKARFHYQTPLNEFIDLKPGDFVVHIVHGIGQFLGVRPEYRDGVLQDFIELRFGNHVDLKLPATSMALIQKYVQVGTRAPKLDLIGSKVFQKRIEKVRSGIFDIASELLELQAQRDKHPGIVFPTDTEWQKEFEEAFPYELTPDQKDATKKIKEDMESSRPMDRLLCGDVGFGKTEVAIRAMFKAVSFNKQVAFLAPTSVLAKQHYLTLKERMADFPIEIEYVSKYLSPREQKKIVERTKQGQVDILIGTHRLLSQDVAFHDIGLLVIDEEQRFGVEHKEKLKKFRATVDILTLTATPIPRTLNMALMGIRDISVLATPPRNRHPIITRVIIWDTSFVRQVIMEELYREGQVYFVHNRVETIEEIQILLQQIVPEARFDIVHGQMEPKLTEARMTAFLEKKIDVLVCTSIIEFGLDIPNVNTLLVHHAEQFGLSDLHQLRGRVGRYDRQAYAYFIVPEHKLHGASKKRMKAIEEYSQLGAGFQLSLRDLEIRGAGNIIGYEQSGHIASIGYELYCQILKETVALLKKEPYTYRIHPDIKLQLETRIPEEYIFDSAERMNLYRKLSAVMNATEYFQLEQECLDLYGPFPTPFQNILLLTQLRVHAEEFRLAEIYERENHFLIRYLSRPQLLKALSPKATIRYPQENYALCFISEKMDIISHLKRLFSFSSPIKKENL